jgi:hypothetical protein
MRSCTLEGWSREDAALTDTISIQNPAVTRTGLGLEVVQVGQPGVAAQAAGVVDDGLDAHGPAVFEYCLIRECR